MRQLLECGVFATPCTPYSDYNSRTYCNSTHSKFSTDLIIRKGKNQNKFFTKIIRCHCSSVGNTMVFLFIIIITFFFVLWETYWKVTFCFAWLCEIVKFIINFNKNSFTLKFGQIATAMNDCKFVIACVSSEYADSDNSRMEFQFATKSLKKPVIVALVGKKLFLSQFIKKLL